MSFAKDSYWMKSGIYTLLQRFSALIFGLGGFMMLVRILPKDQFGTLALFTTVIALVEVARNGLVQNAQIKFAASAKEEELPVILNSAFTLNVIITLASIIILIALAYPLSLIWSSPKIATMFYISTVMNFGLIFFTQFNFIQQAKMDFRGIFFSSFIRQGSYFIIICIYFLAGAALSLEMLVIYQTLGVILGALIGYTYVKGYYKPALLFHWEWVKKLFNYGKFVFGTNISAMIFSSVDQMILGAMLMPVQVAIYNTANRMNNIVDIPVASVASIVFPKSAQRVEESGIDSVVYLYERSVGLLLAILFPIVIGFIVLAKPVVSIIAGEQYLAAVPIMQLLMASAIVRPFVRQFGTALDSIGKPKINFRMLIIISAVNIAANYLCIFYFGTIGAAIGTSAALLVFFISTQIILKREINAKTLHTFVYMWDFYKKAFSLVINKIKGPAH